ncbi:MAG: cytochrome o ubiquinol oxidase subunit IV [Coxiellaceae bacterium]|nr:cytochrome o ubiquinol oxidase subunit IV [Coxiellaceae bacterium]|tara:strand:+ start:1084 stop:1437 length:354 start_codon:yes stop_codon:yes gene_type:complete
MNQVTEDLNHDHDQDFGTGKKTFGVYFSGFLLCVILTLIPFLSVIHSVGSTTLLLAIVLISALLQFFVQVICFLRLNTQTEQGVVNIMSFIFTGVVLVVVIGGSVWIMMSLNYFMMH